MAIEKISADYIFSGNGDLHSEKVLIHEDGKVIGLEELSNHDPASINMLHGILCPGFINTHCHLELSHMKDRIESGTGLLPFLQKVVGYRDIDQDEIEEAIIKADLEMQNEGIVAVGDISNKIDTAAVKSHSPISYYTFVEMFDFMQPSMTEATIAQYSKIYKGQSRQGQNRTSYAPHAPYTVSCELFRFINQHNPDASTVSIHNQETLHENQFFQDSSGGFIDFFKSFGFSMDEYKPNGKSSIHYALQHMNPNCRTLFVHNTISTSEDIREAHEWSNNVFWATCANANLYIENSLPDYQAFIDEGARMTIGTDSLSSNWQLSVLEEIKTISKYNSYIPIPELLKWATNNGAEALGYDELFGKFSSGMAPGINLIAFNDKEVRKGIQNSHVIKLV